MRASANSTSSARYPALPGRDRITTTRARTRCTTNILFIASRPPSSPSLGRRGHQSVFGLTKTRPGNFRPLSRLGRVPNSESPPATTRPTAAVCFSRPVDCPSVWPQGIRDNHRGHREQDVLARGGNLLAPCLLFGVQLWFSVSSVVVDEPTVYCMPVDHCLELRTRFHGRHAHAACTLPTQVRLAAVAGGRSATHSTWAAAAPFQETSHWRLLHRCHDSLNHRCMGVLPTKSVRIVDPLYAHGFVLLGAERPIVLCAVDWCEIRNGAYDNARRAGTSGGYDAPMRVGLFTPQHDAPVTMRGRKAALRSQLAGELYDEAFTPTRCAHRTALQDSLASARHITHVDWVRRASSRWRRTAGGAP